MKKPIILVLAGLGIWYFWPGKPAVKNAGRPVQTIVAFGDSLTFGKGAGGPQKAYPALLEQWTGKKVINLGVSGDTALNAPQRLPDVLAARPDMVLIEFGGNDYMQSLRVEEAVESVSRIVEAVQQAGAIAVIVDTGAPGMGAYTSSYQKLAKEKQAVFVPGILRNIFHKREYKDDMVHPNAAGYQIVAQRIYKGIKSYL